MTEILQSQVSQVAIYNRLKVLIAEKEFREGRKLPYRVIAQEAKIPTSTITAYITQKVNRFDASTLEAFCRYFNCQPGDILIYDEKNTWDTRRAVAPPDVTEN